MATSKTRKSSGSKPIPERFGKLGWKPDLPDHRDHIYAVTAAVLQKLPPKVDLRAKCPPVYNQGRIGSCTANAIAGAIQFQRRNAKQSQKPDFMPSRLFIYYNERAMEGSIGTDAGAQIRDGIKSVVKQGVCPDALWPYDDTPAASEENPVWAADALPATKPSTAAYKAAKNYQVISYQRLPRVLNSFRGCLAEGNPFVFGFSVYSSLYGADGMPLSSIPLPGAKDDLIGGHAVLAVGYDDARQVFIVRNSWGSKAQDKGYFYLPYAYLTDTGLSDDFWTIKAVE